VKAGITHHALSRLAQRCGACDAADLVIAADELFHTLILADRDPRAPVVVGTRLPFTLPHRGTEGVAILSPYDRGDGNTAVITTILDPEMVS
jgi:hypothetical protein